LSGGGRGVAVMDVKKTLFTFFKLFYENLRSVQAIVSFHYIFSR